MNKANNIILIISASILTFAALLQFCYLIVNGTRVFYIILNLFNLMGMSTLLVYSIMNYIYNSKK